MTEQQASREHHEEDTMTEAGEAYSDDYPTPCEIDDILEYPPPDKIDDILQDWREDEINDVLGDIFGALRILGPTGPE
jgi:hypothetical protein